MTKILGLIPARGGSKRLPGKNLKLLNGIPLVQWTLNSAIHVPEITHIAVTTDHRPTAQLCIDWMRFIAKPLEWIKRPYHIAQGITPPIMNVQHAISWYRGLNIEFDHVAYLQPTSPLRVSDDISAAIGLHLEMKGDAVISVTEAGERWIYEVGHANRLRPIGTANPADRVVSPNGAIYIISREALERGEDWWTGVTYAYFMAKERSIDIDTSEDFALAEKLIGSSGNVSR